MGRLFHWMRPKPPTRVRRVVYISRARSLCDPDTLARYCRNFSVCNALLGVTGLLIHSSSHFMQILEAESAVMDDLLRRISSDYRHTHFQVLADEPVSQRLFENCRMGLLDLSAQQPLRLPDLESMRGLIGRMISDPPSAAEGMRQLMRWMPQLMKKTVASPA